MWRFFNSGRSHWSDYNFFVIFYICTIIGIGLPLLEAQIVNLISPPAQQYTFHQPCDRTRRVFTDSYGEISDGPIGFNYTQNSHCEWLIKAKNNSQFITLVFHTMGTECSYDYIFVYDGDSFESPLLGSFSGKTLPPNVIATSGSMLILLYSDTNYVLEGFQAEFYVSNCPNNCTNQGKCVGHRCVCQGDWIGKDCGIHACPDNCGSSEGRGICSKEHCRCQNGYSGKSCSLHNLHPDGNKWHWMSTFQGGLSPRAGHTSIYISQTDSLYVFGGYDLNNVLASLQIYRFNKSTWEDEWGISLRSRHFPKEIDNVLLKAVLNQDEEPQRWGLKNDASFFRNILLTISDQNFVPFTRTQRSPGGGGGNGGSGGSVIGSNGGRNESHDITDFLEEYTDKPRPSERYGHAAAPIQDGFVIYGGKLSDGSLSNELWFFNISIDSGQWELRAINSTFTPPSLTRHTLTMADDWLYLFGGSLANGEFSSRIYKIKLSTNSLMDEQWQEVIPRGGKILDVRIVAHSTVYHEPSNSLIVYGGITTGVPRFSKLSDKMFAFQIDQRYWSELLYPRTVSRDAYIPHERAFHTANVIGNYMVIFGGYTHRHNKDEICYDNQIFLYHLGCHTWINQDVLGTNSNSEYPKKQGVFAHTATLRNKNTLLIVGGYHGNVNADLLAYTLPAMFIVLNESVFDPEAVCPKHTSVSECLSDPECGWCSADNVCYGRTIGANCTTNLQTTRCPGICPALADCHACLIHGSPSSPNKKPAHSVANKFGLNQCSWCVQNARCHHRDNNYGVCGEDTPSQEPGWWGITGTEILNPHQCTELDHRPGLTFLKYLFPVNWTQPDDVSIINATMVDFLPPSSTTHTEQYFNGEIVAKLLGFIRRQVSRNNQKVNGEQLQVCASYSEAKLKFGETYQTLKEIIKVQANETQCFPVDYQIFTVDRLAVDFQAKRMVNLSTTSHFQHSKMGLQHNVSRDTTRPFTFEYLEPYANGTCSLYQNCKHCLSDSLCGWCELTNKCVSRQLDEQFSCSIDDNWQYLIIQPLKCANCTNYISCDNCVDSGTCEWWAEDAKCFRIGRARNAVRSTNECPRPCSARENCSACLEEKGRCVWCEGTQECFSFSVYTSEYQFGICREWLDHTLSYSLNTQELSTTSADGVQAIQTPLTPPKQQCKSCTALTNCSSCLQSLNCGWCFDRDNPIEGICMQGDFNRSVNDCGVALNTTAEEAEWAYAQCPDVDECGLGLHDCHREAKCTNTHGSYNCHCRRGFIGDGRTSCVRTCFEQCSHGFCSGSPDYVCKCDLGWRGADCSQNCGCNNHSTCDEQLGKCDKCQNWTEGEFCEQCRPGSYGNATSSEGCKPCECNGHGNQQLGICDVETGECYCKDNTEGLKCEKCIKNYYGDPTEAGQCYFQCEARGMLKDIGKQGIGSYQSYKNHWGPEANECLWIVSPHTPSGSLLGESLIQLNIDTRDLNVTCGENAIFVYDGLPDLIGNTQQSQLLAVFCSEDTNPSTVEARSGHLTVHYKQGPSGQGFNATYMVRSCTHGTCLPPHVCKDNNHCGCMDGFTGHMCEIEVCPSNCSAHLKQGHCDRSYGRCICSTGYGGLDCSIVTRSDNIVITELFNSQKLNEPFEHLRKTLPRFGHSLVADKRGSLWMFGGYSLSHGPLNDIRQFDTKNNTWIQVTVDSTPEAKMPLGRYFHGSDILHSKQIIYIFGGLTGGGGNGIGHANNVLNDFWQFSLVNQRWDEVNPVEKNSLVPPNVAGHTLTLIKSSNHEGLLIVGGFSQQSMNTNFYEYNLTTNAWSWLTTTGTAPKGIYGHSTIFHQPSQVLYVFGGYEYYGRGKARISNRLYAFDYSRQFWSILPSFNDLNSPNENLPRGRFLHSAVTTDNYMVVFGGRTDPKNSTDVLIAYVYSCNQWVRLTQDVHIVGSLPIGAYAQAMTLDQETDAIYIVGGWDGSSQSRVSRITMPVDHCELWSSGKYLCRHFMGCSFCSVKFSDSYRSECYSYERDDACPNKIGGTLMYNRGEACDLEWIEKRNCTSFDSCESCLASWPTHPEKTPACKWCDGCEIGKCIPANEDCKATTGRNCEIFNMNEICTADMCSRYTCFADDCWECMGMPQCEWSDENSDKEWRCMEKGKENNSTMLLTTTSTTTTTTTIKSVEVRQQITCGSRCEKYLNCSSCLSASSYEGGFTNCRWSTQLNECISPSYQSIYCTGGVCGLVLTPSEEEHCPEPCNAYTQCATCLRHAHCGWCSKNNTEGDGVCTEGSLESPAEHPAASTCDIIYASRNNLTEISPEEEFIWNYVKCPPENECKNGHHNCDPKSERCVDQEQGYKCECDVGYKLDGERCIPVCSQGCVRGTCIDPNVCECDFGYVGANCSIQCQCNGHSDCRGPDKLDECIKCHNNTIGAQCDKCKPLFVGNPKNNGECVPCLEYCNGHSDVCIDSDAEPPLRNMTKLDLTKYLQEGPVAKAVCLRCANQTADDRCEGCIFGHFRGGEDTRAACRPCQCHGHGDSCDPITGEKCNCGNNTESDPTCAASSSKNSAQQCWTLQCSKCRDSYLGIPTDGHHCYKQITIESKMCFDAKTIDECKKPVPLKPGQTVFFALQPRFMNVDIRVIIDVTMGELDLFMSPQEDSFVVLTNQTTGHQDIFLDNRYFWYLDHKEDLMQPININPHNFPSDNSSINSVSSSTMMNINSRHQRDEGYFIKPHIHDCHPLSLDGFSVKDRYAKDLSTYVTLTNCNTLLRVFGLKNRLVLTFPQSAHNLSATRFYIIMRAASGSASYGLIFFRQDQLHIDLFVFFSVFFSCFFLFLAVCVVAWKTKQAADVRRSRRRQVVEMLHMAKRPFSSVTILVGPGSDTPMQHRRRLRSSKMQNSSIGSANTSSSSSSGSSTTAATALMMSSSSSTPYYSSSNNHSSHFQYAQIRPVAIEPTADGSAAVGTVFIRLPGKAKSPVSLALGSALTVMSRQSSINTRAFLRRRGSCHQQQQQQQPQPPQPQQQSHSSPQQQNIHHGAAASAQLAPPLSLHHQHQHQPQPQQLPRGGSYPTYQN